MGNNTAILGGSFNPVHLGHINIAKAVMREFDIKRVVFLPNANPPHKDAEGIIPAEHRYNMVKLAMAGSDGFELSDYEMHSKKPSYTIDTMRYMTGIYKLKPYFIIGADSLYTLHKWKNYDELIKECKFIVADRNCNEGTDIEKTVERINQAGGSIKLMTMPKYNISSTEIREGIANGKDMSAYLPTAVAEYIEKFKLYR